MSGFLRGTALATHVRNGLATGATAEAIASSAGYHADSCAQRLASAGHAPLGRALLARGQYDQAYAITVTWREDALEAERRTRREAAEAKRERRTSRPPMTHDELLETLTDLAECGMAFAEVATYLGFSRDGLRARARRAGCLAECRALFPEGFGRPSRSARTARMVGELLELAEAGESWIEACRKLGYKRPASLARRLSEAREQRRVQAAFGDVSIWTAA